MNRKRIICVISTLILVITLTTPFASATQSQIDELKESANQLSQEKEELRSQLASLTDDKNQAIEKKELLDQEIAKTSEEIQNTQEQITLYTQMIDEKEAELADAQEKEAVQYDLFCRRVRKMEERGGISYWSILFRASSFTDLLSRLDAINEIMEADKTIVDTLRELESEISTKKEELETSKTENEELKATLESRKKELNTQRVKANQVIQKLAKGEESMEAAIADLEKEQSSIQDEIKRLNREIEQQRLEEEQRRAQQEAAARRAAQATQNQGGNTSNNSTSNNNNTSSGNLAASTEQPETADGYIWPVDSRYITSTVGGRESPGGIGSTNHQGTDIGRVGYTSSVYAAKAGTVIVSQHSSSYGEYIVLSHSSGNTTLYAHLSTRKVSVGQYVNQGDVIGITGSTGNSTGPHLHFEVMENDTIIDPLEKGYLSGASYSSGA